MLGLLYTVGNQPDNPKSVPIISNKTDGQKASMVGIGSLTNSSPNTTSVLPDLYINGQKGVVEGNYLNFHVCVPIIDSRLINPSQSNMLSALDVIEAITVYKSGDLPFILNDNNLLSGNDSINVNGTKKLVIGDSTVTRDFTSLNVSVAIAMLVKAVQELLARVETLEGGENP